MSRFRARRIVAWWFRWATNVDPERRAGPANQTHIGWVASAWATAKLGVVGLIAPLWAPIVTVRAALNHRRARHLIGRFPHQIRAIADGRNPTAPANLVVDVDAQQQIVIFSDLHRCVPGRVDWPARQRTKELYAAVLERYASDLPPEESPTTTNTTRPIRTTPPGWTLCENGDIEDYWMVGGSALGTVYDVLRIVGSGLARYRRPALLTETYLAYLCEIIDNNAGTYAVIRDRFVRHGRYVRTIGNHDNANAFEAVQERLQREIGTFPIGDYLALRDGDGHLVGVVCHGHHTDGWNAPARDNLGKLSSWIANTLIDVPRLRTPEGLPDAGQLVRLMEGGAPNRLLTVHPTFGANREYDSLDEELLFRAVSEGGLEDIWMIMGHTHSPVLSPTSRTGRTWERYVNSGSGITDGFISAIEWDGTGPEITVRLVTWSFSGDDLVRTVLHPSGSVLSAQESPLGDH